VESYCGAIAMAADAEAAATNVRALSNERDAGRAVEGGLEVAEDIGDVLDSDR
jgi:hypothetical protein